MHPCAGDVLMGPTILAQVADVYRKLRFTLRFLLGNLADFAPHQDAVPLRRAPRDRPLHPGLLRGPAHGAGGFIRNVSILPRLPGAHFGHLPPLAAALFVAQQKTRGRTG